MLWVGLGCSEVVEVTESMGNLDLQPNAVQEIAAAVAELKRRDAVREAKLKQRDAKLKQQDEKLTQLNAKFAVLKVKTANHAGSRTAAEFAKETMKDASDGRATLGIDKLLKHSQQTSMRHSIQPKDVQEHLRVRWAQFHSSRSRGFCSPLLLFGASVGLHYIAGHDGCRLRKRLPRTRC